MNVKEWGIRSAAAGLAAALALVSPTAQVAVGHPAGGTAAAASYDVAVGADGPANQTYQHPGRGRGHGRGPVDEREGRGPKADRDDKRDDDDDGAQRGRARGQNRGARADDADDGANPGRARGHGRGARADDRDEDDDREDRRDCSPPWRNHGHYVSCVARGEVAVDGQTVDEVDNPGSIVRQAAHSDVGKPDEDDGD